MRSKLADRGKLVRRVPRPHGENIALVLWILGQRGRGRGTHKLGNLVCGVKLVKEQQAFGRERLYQVHWRLCRYW